MATTMVRCFSTSQIREAAPGKLAHNRLFTQLADSQRCWCRRHLIMDNNQMCPEKGQPRLYFSSRKGKEPISAQEAHWRLLNLFVLYRDRDYFKQKLGTSRNFTSDELEREAVVRLGFPVFPLKDWASKDVTEDHIFDVIEFLFDHVSKPGALVDQVSETNWHYQDYDSYDDTAGREEFRASANIILADLGEGFELGQDGQIRANGTGGLEHIIGAQIVPFDEANVDSKVRAAIERWRKRHATLDDKKEAVRLLADVFEWLKDTQQLQKALVRKDESDLFNIANNFSIRHHEQAQKTELFGTTGCSTFTLPLIMRRFDCF
jgi:hypothetical protein